jgi:hypothetical protein
MYLKKNLNQKTNDVTSFQLLHNTTRIRTLHLASHPKLFSTSDGLMKMECVDSFIHSFRYAPVSIYSPPATCKY